MIKLNPIIATLIVLVLLILSLLSICSNAPSTINSEKRLKVFVLSADAVRFDHFIKLVNEGKLPNISNLLGGVYAELLVVFPTATAVSHAAISTGAPPGVNGIVGNSIHLPNTTIISTVSGFSGFYLLSEPIWIAADKQGLKSIVVSFPQSTPPAWNVTRAILFNIYDASAAFTSSTLYTMNTTIPGGTYINFTDATNWSNVENVLGNVSRALESSIRISDTIWYLYLADLNGDEIYDKLVLAPEKDLAKAYAIVNEREWSRPINTTIVSRGKTYTIAPLFKALRFNPISDFRLYRGLTRPLEGTWYNNEQVTRDVWNNIIVNTGTFTDGDSAGLSRGWFDEETYIETVYFTNKLFMEFTAYLIKNYEWDLVMTYTPVIDNVYHQFLGQTNPAMPYYDPGKADYYWGLIEKTYKMIDEFIGLILNNIDLDNTVLLLISDHGQVPIAKVIYINGILHNYGFIAVDAAFRVNITGTKAYAPWHSHIFINLAERETNGTVPPEEYESTVYSIVNLLRSYKDPETGVPIFDLVVTRNESTILGLGGVRTGDIIFALKPGYTSSTALIKDPLTAKAVEVRVVSPYAMSTGDHGPILPHYPELRGVFVAFGPGIRGGYLGIGLSLQVAPTIARILGIDPPADAKLPPLFDMYVVTETATSVITSEVTKTTTQTETISVITTYETTMTTTEYITQTTLVKETITQISTQTVQQSVTITNTVTNTITQIIPKAETSTTTIPIREIDLGTTIGVGLALLALGLVLGIFTRRRRL